MKAILNSFSAILAVALLQSCATIYHPGVQNIPLLKEKGEVKLAATVNDYQAAYALTKHIGVMANARYLNQKPVQFFNLVPERVTNKMLETGIGYFTQGNKKWTSDIYGGVGVSEHGLINAEYEERLPYMRGDTFSLEQPDPHFYDVKTRATRFFLQSSVGFASKYIDVAFSNRFVALRWNSIKILENGSDAADYPGYRRLKFSMFAEPAITTQVGYKWIKLRIQTGLSFRMHDKFEGNQVMFGNIGIVGDIARWYND